MSRVRSNKSIKIFWAISLLLALFLISGIRLIKYYNDQAKKEEVINVVSDSKTTNSSENSSSSDGANAVLPQTGINEDSVYEQCLIVFLVIFSITSYLKSVKCKKLPLTYL